MRLRTHARGTARLMVAGTAVLLSMAACSGPASSDGQVELVVAGTLPSDTAMIQGAERFAEEIAAGSGGGLTADVFSDGQLGGEPAMLDALQIGTIDIAMVGAPLLASYCPALGLTSLPYALQGETPPEQYENLQRVVDAPEHAELIEECAADAGFRILDDSWWYGNREMTSNVPITMPEDLEGLRVRTPEGRLHSDPFVALGAEPVPMAQSEVYTALETGVIDAQENPFATTYKQGFSDVQTYLNLTGLMTHTQMIVMSEERFAELTEEQQDLLREAVREAGNWQSEEQMQENVELHAALEEEGMQVVEPDLDAFRVATEEFVRDYCERHGIDLEAFRAAQQ